jgi:hypothetical protein
MQTGGGPSRGWPSESTIACSRTSALEYSVVVGRANRRQRQMVQMSGRSAAIAHDDGSVGDGVGFNHVVDKRGRRAGGRTKRRNLQRPQGDVVAVWAIPGRGAHAAIVERAEVVRSLGADGKRGAAGPDSRLAIARHRLAGSLASSRSQAVISRCQRGLAGVHCSSCALLSAACRCAGRSAASQAGRSRRGIRDPGG